MRNNNHVKFVSQTGNYPNLCRGDLTLEIDGEIVTFGYGFDSDDKPKYGTFWSSGGFVFFDEQLNDNIGTGEWEIDVDRLPEKFRRYAREIGQVFNENVEYGCCGGCI